MIDPEIVPYTADHRENVLDLVIDAWAPVFARTQNEVPRFVFDAFYPRGWQTRQSAEVADLLDREPENIWLAFSGEDLAGFIGLRIHPDDQMGEIHIVAVSPKHQRQGIGRQLLRFAEDHVRVSGMRMVMVETIGDTGHEPARRAYETFGFKQWPVARYFKAL